MRRFISHLSVAVFVVLAAADGPAAQVPDNVGSTRFTIFLEGNRIGTQESDVARTPTGWKISSVGRLEAPLDLLTTKFEMTYTADWQPQRLVMEGFRAGEPVLVTTEFGPTTAKNDVSVSGRRVANEQSVSPRAVVLPANLFAAYEALAARLVSATPGTTFPVYVVPEFEATATVDRETTRQLVTPSGDVTVREVALTLSSATGKTDLVLWIDHRQRLAKLAVSSVSLVVLRDDLNSVMTRVEPMRNPGDESVFIPSNGFSLAGTFTPSAKGAARPPVVVLVPGTGTQGRDYLTHGIPVFGQLAGAVAAAGYAVVRYDGRGIGQSGGRTESAGLPEYSDDVLAVIAWLKKRKQVDADRIALVAYSESGPIAMIAATREKRVKGLGLLATPGTTGREVTMEQQERLLTALRMPEADRKARIALQTRVNEAVATGKGWENIPADVRRQADSPFFRTWLLFDPAAAIKKIKQPLFIAQGSLDTEIPPAHADRLEQLSLTVRKAPPTHTQKLVVPGVNHLLVPATTGSIEEYASLEGQTVTPAISGALVIWLQTVLAGD